MLIDENVQELHFFILKIKEDSIYKIWILMDEKKHLLRVKQF